MEDSLVVEDLAAEEAVAVDSKIIEANTLDKEKCFKRELSYIKNERIRESAVSLVKLVPDYFFHEAASSTGKYHPSFSQGEGGLLRHTKAAVRIAKELLSTKTIGEHYTSDERDLIIIALILHDSIKRGEGEAYTRFDHPLLASSFVRKNKDKTNLSEAEIDLVCSMIETHMGEWTKDYNGNEVLVAPKNKYQKFVHMCDLLSSKKFLDIKFDENNDIVY